ncbi:TPA: two-component system response regulator TtrR [Klebsiella pneumoniae]|uniref:tetrathionate respiration response regulator TtrR n=1 Tax=Klebsiella pneumoniae TaxID=573 RepID=UPI000E2DA381|nr:tetrathionate respiration response regulator TtrR [Klebsiella pneumoniae]HDU6045749.1 two-component system response regulator TtrR [Klebsiella pneumoniae subsp. pneumoniae]MBC4298360.1 two-component system response regulator TtrR [Klebsiella pneumoniae]MBG2358352.1 two-component system response regulator TtrR [Klebsiella pneumoniae]MBZ1559460.1 two-component system response regulator TtrR [Klebsiella pneumoniae]MCM0007505.1 tetrathionate respiration response regulator TtrR [Klebsiella pneum
MAIIHLLDDDLRVTRACAFLLESLGYEVMCWAEGEMFLAQANLYQAGVVLLDMRMPGLDGRGVHEALRQSGSTLGVVFLTGHGDVPMAVEQMKQGAVDFLQKPVSVEPLQAALERALELSMEAVSRQIILGNYQQLTPKERELALLVVQGLMNREIAQVMNIAVRTVEVHRARVMEKMHAGSLAELVWILQQVIQS